MSLSINTNVISLTVQRSFNASTAAMNDAMEKMTTGYKINSAKDDAAGYGVVNQMESIISGYSVAETNGQMGSSLLSTQEGVLDIMQDYLQRIRDLTEQAANGTYATSSRNAIASEISQRMEEINRLCSVTNFNGLSLLDGSQGDVNLQVGVESGMENVIVLDSSLFASAMVTALFNVATGMGQSQNSSATEGVYDYEGADGYYYESAMMAALSSEGVMTNGVYDASAVTITAMCNAIFTNDNSSREFLNTLDTAIEDLSNRATEIGSYMNRVDSAVEGLALQSDNLTEAKSLIKDADVAEVSSEYLSYQILQEAGATMLTTANQTPSIALNLI